MKKLSAHHFSIIAIALAVIVAPLLLGGCPPHEDLQPRSPTGAR